MLELNGASKHLGQQHNINYLNTQHLVICDGGEKKDICIFVMNKTIQCTA